MPKRGFDFPKRASLKRSSKIHIIIYVPSTKEEDKQISKQEFIKRIRETRVFLRNNLGGSTTVSGIGDWTDSGKTYTEKVAKVESFATVSDYDKADLKIKKWIFNKKMGSKIHFL